MASPELRFAFVPVSEHHLRSTVPSRSTAARRITRLAAFGSIEGYLNWHRPASRARRDSSEDSEGSELRVLIPAQLYRYGRRPRSSSASQLCSRTCCCQAVRAMKSRCVAFSISGDLSPRRPNLRRSPAASIPRASTAAQYSCQAVLDRRSPCVVLHDIH